MSQINVIKGTGHFRRFSCDSFGWFVVAELALLLLLKQSKLCYYKQLGVVHHFGNFTAENVEDAEENQELLCDLIVLCGKNLKRVAKTMNKANSYPHSRKLSQYRPRAFPSKN